MYQDWYFATAEALRELWIGFLEFIPNLIGAIIIFVIGWIISVALGRLVSEILKRIRFNTIFEKGSWDEALAKADLRINPSEFIGAIVKWVFMIVFLLAAVEILGLSQFAGFLTDVLNYLPNVIVAVLIFVVAVIISDFLDKVVRTTVAGMKTGYASLAGMIVRWSIWIFAILAILIQLQIAPDLIRILFTGIVALIVIAGGLAFGLGGKDMATDVIQNLRGKLKK